MREQAANRWRALRADPLLVVGVAFIMVQTGVRAAVVLRSYFWQDDYFSLSLLRRLGLSQEFVVRDHNGHLEIGPNLIYGLIGRGPELSFLPAALILLALQVTASCLLLAVLRELFGRSPWILVPFVAYLFTPLALFVATWFSAGLEALPLQIAMLTAVFGGVRAYRSRSWAWAAVSAAGTATGLLFWDKAVLILPALVAVLLLVEEAGTPWRRSLRQVADFWPFLLPHALLVAAYVPFYLSVVGSSTLDPDPGSVMSTAADTLFATLLPGLVGGPWTAAGSGAVPVEVWVVLALIVAAVSIRLRGSRAVKAWLLVAGYLVMVVAVVQLTSAATLDIGERGARDIVDALPVIVIGWCAAFNGPRRAPRAAVRRGARPGRRVASAAAVSALLAASCLVTVSLAAAEVQHRSARDFVAAVLDTMDADPDVSVVSSRPPLDVTLSGAFDLEDTLRGLGQERTFDQPATDMRIFDGEGRLRPISLLEPIMRASGPVEGCGWPLPAAEQELGNVPIWYDLQVLRFDYDSPAEVTLHLAVGDDRQDLTVPSGRGQAMFVVTGQQGPVTVGASGAPAETVCVDDVVVGTPWPEGLVAPS